MEVDIFGVDILRPTHLQQLLSLAESWPRSIKEILSFHIQRVDILGVDILGDNILSIQRVNLCISRYHTYKRKSFLYVFYNCVSVFG